jgi:Ca2+-binding RTX toxin-like protein
MRTVVAAALATAAVLAAAPAATAAYTSSMAGTTATMTGNASSDTLVIDVVGGLLRHNRVAFGDPGFNSPFDWSTGMAGDQTLPAGSGTIVNVNAGDGNDGITLGTAAFPVSSGAARIVVNGGNGGDGLVWDDSGDPTARVINFQGAIYDQVFTSTGFSATWGSGGTETVVALAGTNADVISVEGSTAGVNAAILAGPGADTVTVGVRSPFNSLDSLLGPTSVDGGTGTDALFVVDNGNPVGRTWALTTSSVQRAAAASLGYARFESLTLMFGGGSDTMTTAAGVQGFSVTGGNGNDSLMGGGGADTLNGGVGNDVLKSRDTQLDTDICGDGSDSVVADALDGVGPDCELVSRKPSLTRLAITPKRFRPARGGGSIGTVRRGAIVTFTLSEDATVVFKVDKLVRGRRVGGRCVAETRANRSRPACTRVVHLRGSFSRASTTGKNTFQFTGRLRGKALKPGSYKLVAAPRLPNGKLGTKRAVAFRIRA